MTCSHFLSTSSSVLLLSFPSITHMCPSHAYITFLFLTSFRTWDFGWVLLALPAITIFILGICGCHLVCALCCMCGQPAICLHALHAFRSSHTHLAASLACCLATTSSSTLQHNMVGLALFASLGTQLYSFPYQSSTPGGLDFSFLLTHSFWPLSSLFSCHLISSVFSFAFSGRQVVYHLGDRQQQHGNIHTICICAYLCMLLSLLSQLSLLPSPLFLSFIFFPF